MKRLWIALIFALSCSSDGENAADEDHEGPKEEEKIDPPVADQSTTVSFQLTNSTLSHVVPCKVPKRLAGPFESNGITVDGQLDDWNSVANFAANDAELRKSPVSSIKFTTQGRDRFLGAIAAPIGDQIELRFGVMRHENTASAPVPSRVFVIVNDSIQRMVNGELVPVPSAEVVSANGLVEFSLPYELMEGVFLYSNWFFEIVAKSADRIRSDGVTLVDSAVAPQSKIQVRSCEDQTGTRLQIMASAAVPEEQFKDLLGLSEFSAQLVASFGFDIKSMPNTVVIAVNLGDADIVKQSDIRVFSEQGLTPLSVNPLSTTWRHDFVSDIFRILIRAQLTEISSPTSLLMKQALANAAMDRMQEHTFGYEMWTKSFVNEVDSSWERKENADLQSLENQCGEQWCESRFEGRARAFGRILSRRFGANLNTAVAARARLFEESGEVLDYESMMNALKSVFGSNWYGVNDVWAGWAVSEGAAPAGYAPIELEDDDQDGIPTILEAEIGANRASVDTDSDGWSDLAELIAGTDPRTLASHPGYIVIDGLYGDWQSLLTSKLLEDSGISSPSCGAAGDIAFFSALMSNEMGLVFGSTTKQQNGTEPRKWSGFVSVIRGDESESVFQVDAYSGSRSILVHEIGNKDARESKVIEAIQPVRSGSFEFVISSALFKDLGVDVTSAKSVSVRLQNFLVSDESIMCDETPWIKPLTSMRH
jgi:hypothetical protein